MWNSKHTGALIGAAGVVIAALIAMIGSGGGSDKPTVIYVPTPAQPAPVQPTNGQPTNGQPEVTPPVTPDVTPVIDPPASTEIQFHVHDVLTPGMLKETVLVYIDDELVGTISVNQRDPRAAVKVKVPRAGSYRYRLDIAVAYYDEFGDLDDDSGTGRGTIDVRDGDAFDVTLAGTEDEPVILLQKR